MAEGAKQVGDKAERMIKGAKALEGEAEKMIQLVRNAIDEEKEEMREIMAKFAS